MGCAPALVRLQEEGRDCLEVHPRRFELEHRAFEAASVAAVLARIGPWTYRGVGHRDLVEVGIERTYPLLGLGPSSGSLRAEGLPVKAECERDDAELFGVSTRSVERGDRDPGLVCFCAGRQQTDAVQLWRRGAADYTREPR